MKKIFTLFIISLISISPAVAETGQFDFDRWNNILNQIQNRAVQEKIDDQVINDTIQDAAFVPKIVWRDQNQPHFKMPMPEYIETRVSEERIANGLDKAKKYKTLLRRTSKKYGVPSEVLLAFWGMESNYGDFKGKHKISDSFLTLIYEGRRQQFFTEQLIDLMKIASKNKLKMNEIRGAYDGGMGHLQFMPSTLVRYGADGNRDGKVDIIHSIGDAMASAGNYLNKLGWNLDEKIILEVGLPENFDTSLCDGKTKKTSYQWAELGILYAPNSNIVTGLLCDPFAVPSEEDALVRKAYLLYPNFYLIKRWNNSNSYAIAVAVLSEKLK